MSTRVRQSKISAGRWIADEYRRGPCATLYHRFVERSPYALWAVNTVLLAGMLLWVLLDPAFEATLGRGALVLTTLVGRVEWPAWVLSDWRVGLLDTLVAAAALSLLLLAVGMGVGCAVHRRPRHVAVTVLLAMLWTAFVVNHSQLAWWAKAGRLRPDLARFEALAAELRDQWPQQDGALPQLGAFMAYPAGQPAALVLLTPPDVSAWGTAVSVVEHSPRGALRFQLSGAEESDWVEWHPPGSAPTSFVGGLLDVWYLQRCTELGEGWYLARYTSGA